MVVGLVRPVGPPSMISGMRSPIWSRTHAACVHSCAPCRLAEVAVMGNPNRSTTARGMAASGTRRATFPVFAVERRRQLGAGAHNDGQRPRPEAVCQLVQYGVGVARQLVGLGQP